MKIIYYYLSIIKYKENIESTQDLLTQMQGSLIGT